MRFQGKITEWREEQGFGFVAQNGDGRRVFVHAKNFARRGRRPMLGDIVSYRIGMQNGRECALDMTHAATIGAPARVSFGAGGSGTLWAWLASLYLTMIGVAVLLGGLPWTVLGYVAAMNALTYVAYAIDKKAARTDAWRTPEARLHFLALMGGWPAALLAQKRLRHKTGKRSFQIACKVTILLHLTGVLWLFSSYGTQARAVLFGAG